MSSISMASIIHPDNATLTIPEMIRSDEYGLKSTVSAKTLSPRTLIPLATPYSLSKEGGRSIFVIKRFREGYYVCSCPAWKFSQERDKFRRSCPHLVQLLGGEYEDERLKVAKEAPSEIWNVESFRRSTSSSSVATRIAQAKAILDGHLASASQGESPPPITAPQRSPETPLAAPVPPAALQPAVGDASKKRSMPMDDSDTETEEEILPVSSQAARPSLSQPAANEACPPQQSNLSRVVTPPSDGPGPGDHPSPSKQSRRNAAEDDKVALLLAKPWILDPDPSKPRTKPMDPAGWWVSEKLDGVRAYWDGQRLYSRQKLEWNAPAWWKNRLPKDITLDGELWIRRGAFDQTSRVCRTTKSSEWRNIKYMIFDSPSMSARPVEERWAELAKRFGTTEGGDIDKLGGTEIKLVHHVQCRGREHMLEMLNDVNSKGGEGLMLRRPGSRYEFKRGTTLYKLKSFYDAEAVVVGYADGEGRNANRIGALAVQMENGTVFRVGTGLSDAQRENPPPIGTVINYRFQEISEDGFPRFPSFRGVAWDKTRAKDAIVRPRVGKAA
ncbi:hypothetical protein ACQY0O_007355 [Thecaphora frezii]